MLGLHRSGGEALAERLEQLGCAVAAGPAPEPPGDARGETGRGPIAELNDEILASAGLSWRDWVPLHEGWYGSVVAPAFRARARALVEQVFATAPLIAMDDPQMCRLLPFWREVLEEAGFAVKPVLILSVPAEVAASLSQSDGIDPDYAHLLWLRHVLDGEAASRDLPRFFTTDAAVADDWAVVAKAAAAALGVAWPRSVAEVGAGTATAPDQGLGETAARRARTTPLVSDWTRDTFEILERWGAGVVETGDQARLDEIRAQLNQSVSAFAGLLNRGEKRAEDLARARGDLAAGEDAREALQRERADLAERLAEATARAEGLAEEGRQVRSQLDKAEAARVTADKRLAAETERAAAALAQVAALEGGDPGALAAAEAALVSVRAEAAELRQGLGEAEAQLQAARDESAGLTQRLEAAETGLSGERAARAAEQAEAEAARQTAARQTDELDALRQQSEEAEQALHQAMSDLAQRRAETDHWMARAKALETELDGVKRNLAETGIEAGHWSDRCEDLEMRLARAGFEQQSAQALLKQEIEDLRARVSLQESRAGDHRRNVERRVERLRSEAAAELAALRQERDAAQRDGEAALRGKQAEIEALHGEVLRLEAERDIAMAGRDKVLGSTSWRLTAPLRKVVTLLRR